MKSKNVNKLFPPTRLMALERRAGRPGLADLVRAEAEAAAGAGPVCAACVEAELARLRAKNREQARQLRTANESLREKNRELDAAHYVWCSGGCRGGAHRWTDAEVTEELVALAERNTARLRSWWENRKSRAARGG